MDRIPARQVLVALIFAVICLAQPARAQSDEVVFTTDLFRTSAPLQVKSKATLYARYYAPYAIQAALAYAGNHQISAEDFGASTDKANRLFSGWKLQGSSEGYIGCIDPFDNECNALKNSRSFPTTGLSFQVWARLREPASKNTSCSEVSLAFRGTINSSLSAFVASWASNLHSYDRRIGFDDEYDQVGRNIEAIIRGIQALPCYKHARMKPQIVSVGHSLGGGLGLFAALRNPRTSPARITKVITFDSSPVAALDLIDNDTLKLNSQRLTIDRVNQQGEILSSKMIARLEQVRAQSCGPLVRQVEFNAFGPATGSWTQWVTPGVVSRVRNAVRLHQMTPLAKQMVEWSDESQSNYPALPVANTGCSTDYRLPGPDEPTVSMNGRAARMAFAARRVREVSRSSSPAPSWAEPAGEIQAFAFAAEPVVSAGYANGLAAEGYQRASNGGIAKAGRHTRSEIHRIKRVRIARL